MKHPKTDYGTIILHWLFVAAFGVAFVSGMRIATEAPDRLWINLFDSVLPRESVWNAHMQAAVAIMAVSLGHAIYLLRSRPAPPGRPPPGPCRGAFWRGEAGPRARHTAP